MKYLSIIICVALLVGGSTYALFSSKLAFNLTIESLESNNVDTLAQRLDTISSGLSNLTSSIADLEQKAENLDTKFSANNSRQYYTASIDKSIGKLQKIIAETGLKKLGTNMMLDPSVLTDVLEKKSRQKKLNLYKAGMRQIRKDQLAQDEQYYGTEIKDLMASAKANPAKASEVYTQIIEDYPDSYTAGNLMVNKAWDASYTGKLEDAQTYYDMIIQNNLADTVTQRGQKIGMALEARMATAYIQAGDSVKALDMIDRLESHGNDLIYWQNGTDYGPQKTGPAVGQELREMLAKQK